MRRNAHANAAWNRKAGAHDSARRPFPDVFEAINAYEDEQLEELEERASNPCARSPQASGTEGST